MTPEVKQRKREFREAQKKRRSLIHDIGCEEFLRCLYNNDFKYKFCAEELQTTAYYVKKRAGSKEEAWKKYLSFCKKEQKELA